MEYIIISLLVLSLALPKAERGCSSLYADFEVEGEVKSIVETIALNDNNSRRVGQAVDTSISLKVQFNSSGDTAYWNTPSFSGLNVMFRLPKGEIVVEKHTNMRSQLLNDTAIQARTTQEQLRYSLNCILLERSNYFTNGDQAVESLMNTCDSSGRLWITTGFMDATVMREIRYQYLPMGRHIESERGLRDGEKYINLRTYDSAGNLIRDVHGTEIQGDDASFDTSVVWSYHYDYYGNRIMSARYLPGELSDTTLTDYIYDHHGNWIEQKAYARSYYNGHRRIEPTAYQLKSIRRRYIEYYEK